MIICLLALFICEMLLLFGSLVNKRRNSKVFELSVSIALASLYLLLMVIYIPLFSTIMERLRVAFPITYKNIRGKVTIGFFVLMLLMLTRYLIYLAFQFNKLKNIQISEMGAYAIFYISELVISATYIVFLVRVYYSKTTEIERERNHSSVNVDDH